MGASSAEFFRANYAESKRDDEVLI